MELTRLERLQLSNQYRILRALYPADADYYKRSQETVESGYEQDYDSLLQHINDEPLTVAMCNEVRRILGMFIDLQYSYEQLSDKSGINERDVAFPGFDGNNEYHQLGYAEFLKKHGRIGDIEIKNSHAPHLGMYRRMLDVFKPYESDLPLSRERILKVIEARIHPSHRAMM